MLINGSLVADEDYILGLINAHLLSQGRFFFPSLWNKLDFVCVSSLAVLSDCRHVAEQEKATS